jgi:hypothetical protein
MKKNEIIFLSVMLFVSHLVTEFHSFIFSEKLLNTNLDLFLCPSFNMELSVIWYIKMLSEIIQKIGILYVLGVVGNKVSKKFFNVALVWMIYNVIDFLSFIWNYKETSEMYWVLLSASLVSIYLIIFTKDKQTNLKAV